MEPVGGRRDSGMLIFLYGKLSLFLRKKRERERMPKRVEQERQNDIKRESTKVEK